MNHIVVNAPYPVLIFCKDIKQVSQEGESAGARIMFYDEKRTPLHVREGVHVISQMISESGFLKIGDFA